MLIKEGSAFFFLFSFDRIVKKGEMTMENKLNLLEGRIVPLLIKLTLPIIGTSFLEMAYALIDMLWIGKLGASAIAAVGVAGMFSWLSAGLAMIATQGGQVKTGHSLGAQNEKEAIHYASSAIQLGILFAIVFSLGTVIFSKFFIGLFGLSTQNTIQQAIVYLRITCGLIIFNFMNIIMTGILNASGDSQTPFQCNSIGLVLNIVLDPFLIFTCNLGVFGAGLATVLAQVFVCLLFVRHNYKKNTLLKHITLNKLYKPYYYGNVLKIGFPLGLQSMLFSICSMVVAGFVAEFGDAAIAAQKIGTQVENISWCMATGFQTSINSFISQNYGAKKYERVEKGYHTMMVFSLIWGIVCTVLMVFYPHIIYRFFTDDQEVISIGIHYLQIVGLSEFFMILELMVSGAFSGLGDTIPPSIVSIVFTLGRIPVILLILNIFKLDGIWWVISLSGIIKGLVDTIWFYYYKKRTLKEAF